MDTVIVMTHTKIDFDSRIRRQITILSKSFDVILCSQLGEEDKKNNLPKNITYLNYEYYVSSVGKKILEIYLNKEEEKIREVERLNQLLGLGINAHKAYETYRCDFTSLQRKVVLQLKDKVTTVKAILVNDVAMLPIALRLRNILIHDHSDIKLIGDMHELHFDYSSLEDEFSKNVRLWQADTYIPKCNVISTVGEWVAKAYSNRYRKVPVITIKNAAEYNDLEPTKNENTIKLVHVGVGQEARKIERMIECMEYLNKGYTLDLYLISNQREKNESYIEWLRQYIIERNLQDRIRILEPVDSEVLVKTINQYDIGIYYLEPIIKNQENCLPNKLFEFIQARLAVVTTPIPSMKEVIEEYDIGGASEEYTIESFVTRIEEVSQKLDYYKQNTNKAANCLSAEKEWGKMIRYIQSNTLVEGEYLKNYK